MNSDAPAHGTFRAAFAQHDFRALIAHHAASATGQTLGTVAVTAAVWDQTASPGWVAAAAAARLLPYVLVSPFAGVVADRRDRRAVLAASAATRAVLVVLLAGAVAIEAAPLALVALTFAMTAAGTPCYPALAAAMPVVVPAEDLAPANGILTTIESSAFVVGPAIGGAVLLLGPAEAALLVNAAVFVVALLFLGPVHQSLGGSAVDRGTESEGVRDALRAGVRAVVDTPDVLAPLVLVVAVNLVYGGSLVGLLLVATDLLDAGRSGFGLLNAALGAGAFLGITLTNRAARTGAPMRALAVATLLTGIPFALLSVAEVMPVAIVLMVASGMGSVVTEVLAVTVMQRSLPRDVIARVFGMLDSVVIAAVLLGSSLAPTLVGLIGLRASLVVVGAVVPVIGSIVALRLAQRRAAVAGAVDELRAARIALLGNVSWLRELVRPALESLAAVADLVTVPAGTDLVREGEVADHCWVVVDGVVEVWQRAGAPEPVLVATLGPGDGFGEVGLLRGEPRNATVRAATHAELLRIDGGEFLAAVNAVPSTSGAALGGGFLGRAAPSVPDT